MKQFIDFGKIGKFKDAKKQLQFKTALIGFDNEENPIIDENIPYPVVSTIVTEKIHGTNASVCYNSESGFWVQSRTRILEIGQDNYGCCMDAMSKQDSWMAIIEELSNANELDLSTNTLTLFFEYAGGNIQSNSACSGMDKMAIIFAYALVTPFDESKTPFWILSNHLEDTHQNIFNILNLDSSRLMVDFNRDTMEDELIEYSLQHEENSPTGRKFNKENNILEGMVYQFFHEDELIRFKVKGDLHNKSVPKIPKQARKPLTTDEEKKLEEFVYKHGATASRLDQAYTLAKQYGGGMKHIGLFIGFMQKDTKAECKDELIELGIDVKKVMGRITEVSKCWYEARLENEVD